MDLHSQYLSIKTEIDAAISNVINESAFIGGKYVSSFEERFADYQHAKYCVGVGNGTDALEIAIEALDIPSKSEIIVPANSFIASAEAVTRSGHKVRFCDVNSDDYTISIEDLERRINSNTAAIIAVHLYGHPCNMEDLSNIAQKYNLKIIEDCAQAHAAEYKGTRVGAIGDIGCFSFYPGKNLGAFGDAGAIVTNDQSLEKKCRMIANHGRISKYDHVFEGRNSRLDGLQAAILEVKLNYLNEWTEHRIQLASEYLSLLGGRLDMMLPDRKKWARHVYHLFVIRHKDRDKIHKKLHENSIEAGVHYPVALPKLKAFEYLGQQNEDGFAWRSDKTLLSLPMDASMDKRTIESICTFI